MEEDVCFHKWVYAFGLNATPHCIRVYDCSLCYAKKEIKTPKTKKDNYGTPVVTITKPREQRG